MADTPREAPRGSGEAERASASDAYRRDYEAMQAWARESRLNTAFRLPRVLTSEDWDPTIRAW